MCFTRLLSGCRANTSITRQVLLVLLDGVPWAPLSMMVMSRVLLVHLHLLRGATLEEPFDLFLPKSSGLDSWTLLRHLLFAVRRKYMTSSPPDLSNKCSDYQADAYGHCISTLGPTQSYTYSEMCIVFSSNSMVPISTFDGTTLGRNELISLASATDEPRTTLDDIFLTPTEVAEYWGIGTFVPAIPLIYKEEDVKNATETGNDDEEGDDDTVVVDNSAPSRGGVVSVLGATLGLLAGVGLMM